MGTKIDRTINFYLDVFTERKIPGIIQKITYWNGEQTLYTKSGDGQADTGYHKTYSIALIPDYLTVSLDNAHSYTIKTQQQNNLGYAITLEEGFELDRFLKSQFRGNYRNLIKRLRRLETCFNISYKMFYGAMERVDYEFLMNSLRAMLVRRFNQKNDLNEALPEWEEIVTRTFDKVLLKQASIFVIYDNENPVDISINYHFQKIVYGAVSSYNIDYHKFGLGSIEKIKLLEWCQANDYKILEFAYGDLDYKRAWSNCTYKFKYLVIYRHHSLLAVILGKWELLRLYLKEYLKSIKVDVYYKRIKKKIAGESRREKAKSTGPEIKRSFVPDVNAFGKLEEIDMDAESALPLKMIANEFLYATQEHIDHLRIHQVLDAPHTYLISGKKHVQKITVSS